MSKKKKSPDCIEFLGEASHSVTGSMILIQFEGHKYLLECGLYQSSKNDYLDAYRVNSRKFDFDPAQIEYVWIGHPHIDHCGLLPRLVREGFSGTILTTEETAQIMKPLLLNSSYLVKEEARILSKRFGRDYAPIYSEEDVHHALSLIQVYSEYDQIYCLDDTVRFQWLENSHCLGAAQIQIILSGKMKEKKILYTSDLGPIHSNNHFVRETEIPDFFNDVVIMESTYGSPSRSNRNSRKQDLVMLDQAIQKTIHNHGSLVLPAFSFARTQELLASLYELYGHDPDFHTDIVVDSMLSVDLCRLYQNLLINEDYLLWKEIMSWKRLKLIHEKEDSISNLAKNTSQIVISSSGFCTNGRIVDYLVKHLRDENSTICFSGYLGDNPSYLAYRIANADQKQYLVIYHHRVPLKANCIAMSSFSSHAPTQDLVQYASSMKANQIVLVHGESGVKKELADLIRQACSKQNKTTKVVPSTKGMTMEL